MTQKPVNSKIDVRVVRAASDEAFYAWLETDQGAKPADGSTVDYGFAEGFKAGVKWAEEEA